MADVIFAPLTAPAELTGGKYQQQRVLKFDRRASLGMLAGRGNITVNSKSNKLIIGLGLVAAAGNWDFAGLNRRGWGVRMVGSDLQSLARNQVILLFLCLNMIYTYCMSF
ncbi:hypothetical protein CEXT_538761 [Caerostris extrusa]|uniref:Uncharacterized protein n=1 Tax=Caerostris extrusa TaxID=172846 RepID=A0AAV4QVT4_CAEEX|nr:hypothetical protein CEXT_538761 [Caerostris extrusa]